MSPWRKRAWGLLGFGLVTAWFCLMNGPAAAAALLAAVAVHELGHLLALRALGGRAESFSLSPFGAVLRGTGLSYPGELLAVLAGPAANLLCAAGLAALPALPEGTALFLGASVVLGGFNLLPAPPLDGWRALQLALCWLLGPDTGNRWAAALGLPGTLALTGGLLWLMAASGGNLWLLPAAIGAGVYGARSICGETA